MTTEEHICYKFGKDCRLALAIATAESGLNSHAINKNKDKDGTYDLGCWQLNEKWQIKPRGLSRADAFDCKKATDIAFTIYTEQGGFQAWSAFKNKSYSKFLK